MIERHPEEEFDPEDLRRMDGRAADRAILDNKPQLNTAYYMPRRQYNQPKEKLKRLGDLAYRNSGATRMTDNVAPSPPWE